MLKVKSQKVNQQHLVSVIKSATNPISVSELKGQFKSTVFVSRDYKVDVSVQKLLEQSQSKLGHTLSPKIGQEHVLVLPQCNQIQTS